MEKHNNIVAVYGTLRRDFGNHRLLEYVGNTPIGDGKTQNKYALEVNGLPYLFRTPSVSEVVVEVYAVDNRGLKQLDQLEHHPHWYQREEVPVVLQNGEKINAWIYFQNEGKFDPTLAAVEGDYKKTREVSASRW